MEFETKVKEAQSKIFELFYGWPAGEILLVLCYCTAATLCGCFSASEVTIAWEKFMEIVNKALEVNASESAKSDGAGIEGRIEKRADDGLSAQE